MKEWLEFPKSSVWGAEARIRTSETDFRTKQSPSTLVKKHTTPEKWTFDPVETLPSKGPKGRISGYGECPASLFLLSQLQPASDKEKPFCLCHEITASWVWVRCKFRRMCTKRKLQILWVFVTCLFPEWLPHWTEDRISVLSCNQKAGA